MSLDASHLRSLTLCGAVWALAGASGCSSDSPGDPGGNGGETDEFLALTYNVAGLPEPFSSSPDPLTRMPLIGQLLNDYDLTLLQEDWETPEENPFAPSRAYHELIAPEAEHPYRSIPMPQPFGMDPTRPEALLSDGLNEFSRIEFDPDSTEHVRWSQCFGDLTTGASDCMATKGFTRTVHVLAPGVELDVYNLHGEAGGDPADLPLKQLDFEELAAYVKAHSVGRAIIVGGDTNLHTDQDFAGGIWDTFLSATGIVDVCETVDCGSDNHQIDKFAYRSSDTLEIEPLSHVFDREKFTYPGGALSDHDALAVRFRWTSE
jgi:hypothetical protein